MDSKMPILQIGRLEKKPPMHKASAGEGGDKGSVRFAHRPLYPVLQIENKHLASQGSFHFFLDLMKTSFQRSRQKQKPPCGGVCF
jgi:hypothetical protein